MAFGNASSSHTPSNPSGLRQSFTLSSSSSSSSPRNTQTASRSPPDSPQPSPRTRPTVLSGNDDVADDVHLSRAGPSEPRPFVQLGSTGPPSETTALLQDVLDDRRCSHSGPCNHGTFSPRPASPDESGDSTDTGFDDSAVDGPSTPMPILDGLISTITGSRNSRSWRRSLARKVRSKKMSTSSVLAERHGLTDTSSMWVPPFLLLSCLLLLRPFTLSF
ncbi:sulfate transporter [Niveomyces insectorum RCEF 264]|uniref:Sulfate transporter n=1 Tax=Niveomyces insectorum RCEF 264 TaxID=1081102 RepID=A0A162KAC4_9HYPO|nr:sulfate transporter [Niveomyces insectorum RCEF 264]